MMMMSVLVFWIVTSCALVGRIPVCRKNILLLALKVKLECSSKMLVSAYKALQTKFCAGTQILLSYKSPLLHDSCNDHPKSFWCL
jgi:hypothetical protein